MILAAVLCCTICLALVLGTYIGYPLFLWVCQSVGPWVRKSVGVVRPTDPQTDGPTDPLGVTLVISAYNEESVIGDKIENAIALAYPRGKIEIMVISDASTDATDAIVQSYQEKEVLLCRQEDRLGKSAGLSRFVPTARGEFIVFSDANSLYEPQAIRQMVRHFTDPSVGYVVGCQKYISGKEAASVSESVYWKYESWIKKLESQIGSVVGADGAIFAIRRQLFEPLEHDDISDFTLPLKIVVQGYRGVYEKEAVCHERTADDFEGEFHRKARIVNRSFGAVLRVPQALNPFRVGLFAYQLFLHKVVRWFAPFLLLTLFLSSGLLAWQGIVFWQVFLGLQLLFYGLAALHSAPGVRRLKPVYLAYYFCLVNAASALGILWLLAGKRIATWTPQRGDDERDSPDKEENTLESSQNNCEVISIKI